MFDYDDGYVKVKRGESIHINHIAQSSEYLVTVWTDKGPIALDAFRFCFIWAGDWKGNL